jgi:hypothetical protein
MLKTIFGVLAMAVLCGFMVTGAVMLANSISTRQPPQASDLRGLAEVAAPKKGAKGDKLPVLATSFTPSDAPKMPSPPTQPWPVSQYAALGPNPGSSSVPDRGPASGPSDSTTIGNNPFDEAKPAITDLPLPAKPKAAPAKPAKSTNVLLNDAQIAHLKDRLKLTPGQQKYWPEIEVALRGVVQQIYEANKKAHGATVPVDTTTPEVERLKTAAVPLLTQLRPDQKAEVMTLARIIGMEKMIAEL